METNKYIETGILEEYILGLLSPIEMARVESLASKHPEIRDEIERIELTMEEFGQSMNVAPSQNVFDMAMAEITELKNKKIKEEAPVVSLDRNNSVWKPMAMAASICLFLSLGANVWMISSMEDERYKMAQMESMTDSMRYDMRRMLTELEVKQQNWSIVQDPKRDIVRMPGTDMDPNALATIYWDKNDKSVYLGVNYLPSAPDDHQYQLWAIADGKPVDLGVFDVAGNLQKMNIAPDNPAAFAVTLEVEGGSPVPTLERMYMISK